GRSGGRLGGGGSRGGRLVRHGGHRRELRGEVGHGLGGGGDRAGGRCDGTRVDGRAASGGKGGVGRGGGGRLRQHGGQRLDRRPRQRTVRSVDHLGVGHGAGVDERAQF